MFSDEGAQVIRRNHLTNDNVGSSVENNGPAHFSASETTTLVSPEVCLIVELRLTPFMP